MAYQINYPTPTPRPAPAATPFFELEPEQFESVAIEMFEGAVTGWNSVDQTSNAIDIVLGVFIVLLVCLVIYSLARQLELI